MLVTPQSLLGVGLLLAGPASAVDLRQYFTTFCDGSNHSTCRDIYEGVCCRRPDDESLRFKSGSCNANVQKLRHVIYRGGQNNRCGTSFLGNNCGSDNCINDPQTLLTGHKWRRPGDVLRDSEDLCEADQGEAGDSNCNESVEPDLLVINGRAFELNGTIITQEQKGQLWGYLAEAVGLAEKGGRALADFSIPAEFDEFEVPLED